MEKGGSQTVSQKVVSAGGKEVGSIELDARVFGAPVMDNLVHDTVRWQLAKRRSGTHQALTRTMKEGGAKKPYKQKGTGRARAGSSISPLWRGGASIHGPLPRSYDYRLPKRARKQALAAVLSERKSQDKLIVLESLPSDSSKTKSFREIFKGLKVDGSSVLFVADSHLASAEGEAALRGCRNLECVTITPVAGVNVYDILRNEFIVTTKSGINELAGRLVSDSSGK